MAKKLNTGKAYTDYSDFTKETFIDRMPEKLQERGLVSKVANDRSINYPTALIWRTQCQEIEEIPYKKSKKTVDLKNLLLLSIISIYRVY